MLLIKDKIKEIKDTKGIEEYLQFYNREIYLDILSPQIVNQIDKTIRFWNLKDDKDSVPLGNRTPIKIFINSSGGNLDTALALCDIIQMSKTPVYTYNINHADLESLLVLMVGHKRFGYANSIYTIENTIIPQEEDSLSLSIKQYIKNLFCEKAIMSESQFDKYINSEGRKILTSDEAFKLHIINQILQR